MNVINLDCVLSFEYLLVVIYKDKLKLVFFDSYQRANNKRLTLLKNNNDLFNTYMVKVPSFIRKNSKMELNIIYVIKNKDSFNFKGE